MSGVTRRQFIKIGAGGIGAAGLAGGVGTRFFGLDAHEKLDPATDGDEVVPTFCELCFWKCGVLAHVKDGRVIKVVGNPEHPLSRGRLCPRGLGAVGMLYDPDRLKQPLVRVKKRGEYAFEAVSWDVALDAVAEGLTHVRDEHGPEALALFSHGYGGGWFTHLMKAFGSPNVAAPSYAQCRGPREAAYLLTFGQSLGSPEPLDIESTRCLVLIGSHLGENMHNTQVQELATAIDRGAELVVVDPRFSVAASKARYWLPVKPGTDIALILAWLHVIIGEKRYDAEYVAKHTTGFDALAEHVADKTPEWAWAATGLRPELIRESARFIASFRPASLVHPGRHTTWYGDDTQRLRSMAILAAVLGSWGRRGGYLVPSAMSVPKPPAKDYPRSSRAPADRPKDGGYPVADEVIASGVCDATIPGVASYDIKAWLVYGTNLLQALPDPARTRKAIDALEQLVAVDIMPAEICGYADVVLPESTYLERWDDLWAPAYKQPFVALRQPAVAPMYDSRPGWWIARELGRRLGLADYFPWVDGADYVRQRALAAGLDWEALRAKGVVLGSPPPSCEEDGLALAFDTPTQKIELASTTLKDLGFPELPPFVPPEEPPPGSFRLLSGRSPLHTFGRTTNNRQLAECDSENEVWLNVDAARGLTEFLARPLESGERVMLVNQDGARSGPVKLKLTERIRGDCVFLVHGFGHTSPGLRFARGRGADDAALVTRFKVDPIMGGTGMNVNFVRIERA